MSYIYHLCEVQQCRVVVHNDSVFVGELILSKSVNLL